MASGEAAGQRKVTGGGSGLAGVGLVAAPWDATSAVIFGRYWKIIEVINTTVCGRPV